jgi:hypothetical protein
MSMIDVANQKITGHVLIRDKLSGKVLCDKTNAIHLENMSEAIALALTNRANGHIHEMVFGNGGSTVSGTGAVNYFSPNSVGADAQLYNQTYRKIVDDQSPLMPEQDRLSGHDKLEVQHAVNAVYSDIIVTCTLEYNEPSGQAAFDNITDTTSSFVFDELGLKAFDVSPGNGKLLSHVIFHPIAKSLNRIIEIIYTVRIYMT